MHKMARHALLRCLENNFSSGRSEPSGEETSDQGSDQHQMQYTNVFNETSSDAVHVEDPTTYPLPISTFQRVPTISFRGMVLDLFSSLIRLTNFLPSVEV